ncbi:MAG: glutamate-cysteine ligase family protein [Rubrobacteraceae bacterium]
MWTSRDGPRIGRTNSSSGAPKRPLSEGLDPDNFSEECSRSMVEVKTAPAETLEELEREYLANVGFALRVGRELGLRLYPLSFDPSFREEPRYELQIETIGRERFLDAGRCFGVHLHLEIEADVIDPVGHYNLATALDPALIALTRSCPFYEGRAPGLASRTAFTGGAWSSGGTESIRRCRSLGASSHTRRRPGIS